jgi:hypothetical protein
MPWELGFLDGYNERVAILPIVDYQGELDFYGQEYLSLYPYADIAPSNRGTKPHLWINTAWNIYALFSDWIAQGQAAIHKRWHDRNYQ